MKAFTSALFLASLLGCASGAPPSGFERTIYDIRTQTVAVVTMQTNFIVNGSNSQYYVRPVTNQIETYERIPKESVITGIQAGGQIATTFGFGLGGVIASLLLGAYGTWATWRSNRKGRLNAVLAQGIEVAREVIKAQPGGVAMDERFKEQIKSQQVDAGVKAEATAVVDSSVNTVTARDAAERVNKDHA